MVVQVNLSQSLAALSNLFAIILAALPTILSKDKVPSFVGGPAVMLATTAGTAVMAVFAFLDPLFKIMVGVLAQRAQVYLRV